MTRHFARPGPMDRLPNPKYAAYAMSRIQVREHKAKKWPMWVCLPFWLLCGWVAIYVVVAWMLDDAGWLFS